MELHLTIRYPDGRIIPCILNKEENTVGRDENSTLCLDDPNVSGYHARIFYQAGRLWCEDGYQGRPSKNGTWVNNKRIFEPIPLKKSDTLLIGTCKIKINNILPTSSPTQELSILRGKSTLEAQDFQTLQVIGEHEYSKIIATALIIFGMFVAVFGAWFFSESTSPVPKVNLFRVGSKIYIFPYRFTTFALPGRNYTFDAPISGKITRIYKKAGDAVRKGAKLIQFDDTEETRSAQQMKSQCEVLRLRIERIRGEDLVALKKERSQGKKHVEELQRKLEQRKQAYAEGKGSVRDLQETAQELRKSEQGLLKVRGAYRERLKTMHILQKKWEIAKSSYKDKLWKQRERLLLSPIDGYVKDISVAPGSYVHRGRPICRIVDIATIKLCLHIPEKDFPKWSPRERINIAFEQIPGLNFAGSIVSINFRSESGMAIFEIIIDIPNLEEMIRPGMTAKIQYQKKRESSGVLVPQSCIIERHGSFGGFVIKDHCCRWRKVELWKHKSSGKFIVTSGLEKDDLIVVNPDKDMIDGQRVNIGLSGK